MLSMDEITEIFYLCDDSLKEFDNSDKKPVLRVS